MTRRWLGHLKNGQTRKCVWSSRNVCNQLLKSTKQKEIKGDGRGEEDRMKNRKEKERKKSWDQVLKPKYCVGTDPVHWYNYK